MRNPFPPESREIRKNREEVGMNQTMEQYNFFFLSPLSLADGCLQIVFQGRGLEHFPSRCYRWRYSSNNISQRLESWKNVCNHNIPPCIFQRKKEIVFPTLAFL
ncbi:hypothetical protein CEXT_535801 [Caerostris extrusa]|uniref:Uncharacterized protein n=1 Tax=Caerostris extrusa TaxID=172846 RepID=A0AAV4VZY3_CAEEX|nr:hypothetical protein CEXT_535801 [Caerostris extrusa]